ncbi:MAG: hypothetical protein M5U28_48785 [Sandaracinaceae bacterium]|nr:hypothetical protein [Sandaracinaceae bacterium]
MGLTIEAPSVAEYERGLPDGWESFADCQVKAALVRAAANETALLEAALPAPLRALVDDPPLVTAWVPEVFHVGLVLALHEALVREDRAAGFLDWVAERHRELFAGAYAPTLRGQKGERMLKGAAGRVGALPPRHRDDDRQPRRGHRQRAPQLAARPLPGFRLTDARHHAARGARGLRRS